MGQENYETIAGRLKFIKVLSKWLNLKQIKVINVWR